MRALLILLLVAAALASAGCSTRNVRALTAKEIQVMQATHERLKDNRQALTGSLDDLHDNLATALTDEHALSLRPSKRQLLISMKSAWQDDTKEMRAQRAIAIGQLMALSEAESAALEARIAERRAQLEEVKKAYEQLVSSMGTLVEGEKQILAHLEQPAHARVRGVVDTALEEAKALRESLAESDNPRLQRLADQVESAEGKIAKAADGVEKVYGYISKLKKAK